MRIATYNVEWFASLFDENDVLLEDGGWSGRHNVTRARQTEALGTVFQALDADAIMIIEAPNTGTTQSTVRALETFAAQFSLRQNKALIGFANDTQQEIALLYDPEKTDVFHDPQGEEASPEGSRDAPRFDGVFRLDVNVDDQPDTIIFSKPPFEAALVPKEGSPIRLIGVHAKSKAPHGARSPQEEVRISIANRRKQLAQCIWIRQRVDKVLEAGDSLIVLGDFNDGPGLDEYEKLFGRSGVEIVLGENATDAKALFDPHASAALTHRRTTVRTSARFYNHRSKTYLNALLDYVMLSDDLVKHHNPAWRIWHPFDDPACFADADLRMALLDASDHFPVSVDLSLA